MNLAMNTQTIRSAPLEQKLAAIAAAGFSHVELWLEDIVDKPATLRRRLADLGLRCSSFIKVEGWAETDGALMGVADDRAQILGECERRLQLAAELGSPYVIACPAYSHRGHAQPTMEAAAETFREILALGKKIGVLPTIEFLGQSHHINTLDKCLAFLDLVDDPAARMVVDAYHLWRGSGEIGDLARAPLERISLLHVNDADPGIDRARHRDRERVLPGDGVIDLRRFFALARAIGFSGVVSLGVYNPQLWERDVHAVCREGYAKTRAVMETL